MLLYSLLYLLGYPDMTLDEIKRFRQLGSKTAGHPEYGHAAGIETTTGPLGQGLGNAVGMALAERILARSSATTWSIITPMCSPATADLMEGISQEAIALAGHLKLGEAHRALRRQRHLDRRPSFRFPIRPTSARVQASGWNAMRIDGHDPEAIAKAPSKPRKSPDRPTLIACKTHIGYGAPTKADSEKAHGSPLGADEIKGAREKLGWPRRPSKSLADILDSGARRARVGSI
jgi:transketolase